MTQSRQQENRGGRSAKGGRDTARGKKGGGRSVNSTRRGRKGTKGAKQASAKRDIWAYKSVRFRPKTLSHENFLNRAHLGATAVCLVVSGVVVITAFIYRNAYKDGGDAEDDISQEQGRLMGWAENAWILGVSAWFGCGIMALFEYFKQQYVIKDYEDWHNGELPDDCDDEEGLIDKLNENHLKTRYMAYCIILVGFVLGYFYLAVRTWNEGSHSEVKTWPKRRTFKYKNKGTPKEKKYEVYKKVLQINHPECTEKTLSFCSEIKQFNYSLIAATVFHGLLLLVLCFILFRALSAAKRGTPRSLTGLGKHGHKSDTESDSMDSKDDQ